MMTIMTIMAKKQKSRVWTVAEAKARFSEVLAESAESGPQVITRNGKETAVVVSAEEWKRKTRRVGTLVEFFQNSPLKGSGIKLERLRPILRDVDFE